MRLGGCLVVVACEKTALKDSLNVDGAIKQTLQLFKFTLCACCATDVQPKKKQARSPLLLWSFSAYLLLFQAIRNVIR